MDPTLTRCRRVLLAGALLSVSAPLLAAEIELAAVLRPPEPHADALSAVAGVLRAPDGSIYLLDRSEGRLVRLRDTAIEPVSLLGKDRPFRSRKLGGFAQLSKDQFAVANTSDDLLAVVGPDGKAQIVFSGGGSAYGQLKDPAGVAYSTRQRLYVADRSNARVSVYTPDGLFLLAVGEQDPATDKLERPVQVGVDAAERVYVLEDKGPGRLSIYRHNGSLIRRLNAEAFKEASDRKPAWSALAVGLDGEAYIADKANGKILWFDGASGKLLRRFGSRGANRGQFEEVTALATAPNRELIVADSGNKKIEIYRVPAAEKEPAPVTLSLASVRRGAARTLECESAYFLTAELLCIKRSPSAVMRLSADGKQTGKLNGKFSSPRTITSTEQGIAVVDGDEVKIFSENGEPRYAIGRSGYADGEFYDIGGVHLADRLYVADGSNKRVQIFSRDGVFLDKLVNLDDSKGKPPHFQKPGPLTVDSRRNLYVADNGLKLVRVFSPAKELLYSLDGAEGGGERFETILGVGIDRDDNLYVLATTAKSAQQLRLYQGLSPTFSFSAYVAPAEEPSTRAALSIARADKAVIGVFDERRKLWQTYQYLQIPARVGGMEVRGGLKQTQLRWQKVPGSFVARYRVYATAERDKPYEKILETAENNATLTAEQAARYYFYRVSAMSSFDVEGELSTAHEDLFASGIKLYRDKQYKTAAELLERAVQERPDHADALEYLGRALLELGNHEPALRHFRELGKLPGVGARARQLEAQALVAGRQYLAARATIERAIAERAVDARTYLLCGEVNIKLNDAVGAVRCLEQAVKLEAENESARFLLGQAYVKVGAVDKGLAELENAARLAPTSATVHVRAAQVYLSLKRHKEALASFHQALAIDGQNAEARLGAAQGHLALKEYDKARSIALSLASQTGQEAAGQYLLGIIALAQHDNPQEALLALSQATQLDPQNTAAWIALADAHLALKDQNKARAALKKAVASPSVGFEAHWRLARLEQDAKNPAGAAASLEKAVALEPGHYEARLAYARVLLALERFQDATAQAREALGLEPKPLEPLLLIAEAAHRQGKDGEAIDHLKKALALKADSPEIHLKLGRSYLENNVYDQAQAHLEKAVLLDARSDQPHALLGDMFLERRLYDPAIKHFTRAAELKNDETNKLRLNSAYAAKKRAQELKSQGPLVVMEDIKFKRIFAAAYKQYANDPVGTLRLRNDGPTDYRDLKLSFYIKGFMDFPTTQAVPLLKKQSSVEIPLLATFNNKVLSLDEDTRVQSELKLSYPQEGPSGGQTITHSFTLYAKNAILWRQINMVGSFVTPREETLRNFVRQVINQYSVDAGPLNRPLAQAAVVFNAFAAYGLRYQTDPNNPYSKIGQDQVDYVQFPRETLRLKSGDCDDLSVLLAAAYESLGVETAIVDVPGHLFLMLNTGLKEQDRDQISLQDDLLVRRAGEVWIPLEATMVATSFSEAWAAGAQRYRDAERSGTLKVLTLKEAWTQFVPVTLPPAAVALELPAGERVRRLVEREQRVLITRNIERLLLPYRALINDGADQRARLYIGVLYAKNGLSDLALKEFDQIIERDPKNGAAHNNRGNVYYTLNEYERALDGYRYAEELDAIDAGIKLNLALAYYRLGRLGEAKAKYQEAVALRKELSEQYRSFAKLLTH